MGGNHITIVLVCFDQFCRPSASACRSLRAAPGTKPSKSDKPKRDARSAKAKAKSKLKGKGKPSKKTLDEEES